MKKKFFAGIRHPLFVLTGSLFNWILWIMKQNQSTWLKSEIDSTKRGWWIPAKKYFFTFREVNLMYVLCPSYLIKVDEVIINLLTSRNSKKKYLS